MTVYPNHSSYRVAWDDAFQADPPLPLNVDIELASLCNLKCPFCFISDGTFDTKIRQPSDDGQSARRYMPKELAFQIIDECAEIGVPALKFNWRGESTLHPDYSEILIYAANKKSFLDLLINTNANCPEKSINGLMAATKTMVSLDSMNPDTYKIMRRGGSLDRAKEVITELVRRRHPNLWIRRVMTKDNQIEDFYRYVNQEWGNQVKVSQHFCFDRNKDSHHERVGCDHDESTERQYCGYPSQRLVIASAGKVYPCCIDLKEEMCIGKFPQQSLMDIWNSDMLKGLRKELRSNRFHSDICKNCQSWLSYKSPKREYVKDLRVTVSQ